MTTKNGLMAGKRGLVMGVANDHSLGWGIAKALHEGGAELAFTYQVEALGKRVRPLAESVGSDFVIEADVGSESSLDAVFAAIGERWGRLDFLVHSIGATDRTRCAASISRRRARISCARSTSRASRSPICAGARCR